MNAHPPGVRRIEVSGIVQGVGFRPFVYRLATELGLRGDVRNAGGIVVITAAGADGALERFTDRLVAEAPPHATVTAVTVAACDAAVGPGGFAVLASAARAAAPRDLPPDLATCEDCRRELFDPADRRHRYPFVTCVNCGPRASIIEALPYDRERTTMRAFPMCPACAAEYADPADRRFHAEPIACPECGPRLTWSAGGDHDHADHGTGPVADPLAAAEAAIRAGGVVAVKGIGGYQLVCDAADESAVARLRAAKGRAVKPLAVMVPGLDAALALARPTLTDIGLLTSAARPIVLMPARPGALAPGVCGGLPTAGLFLPYSPLHHLLLADLGRPLVVTSGNRADGATLIDDDRAAAVLGPMTDGVLGNDRPIAARYDDSVVTAVCGRPMTVRRARGYAPAPLPLPMPSPEPVLAVGAQLKHTFTIAVGDRAIVGPHTGDLADAGTFEAFERSRALLERLQDADPAVVACDRHPEYSSTRYAHRWTRRIAVQHHHAHVAATAAEHGVAGPFIGVAYDGLGLGDDGTLWGGEILVASYTGYRRVARFARAPLPGGAAAVRRPARMALGYLYGAEPLGEPAPAAPPVPAAFLARVPEAAVVRRMIARGAGCPRASSAGRLFDAVAALLTDGECDVNRYEGEAATRLEALAAPVAPGDAAPLSWRVTRGPGGLWVYDCAATLRAAVEARAEGEAAERIAAAFHETLVAVTAVLCERAAAETGIGTVCLSGGVFQNRRLAGGVRAALEAAGFAVHVGERVPVGDGGISYGQAAVAAALLAKG